MAFSYFTEISVWCFLAVKYTLNILLLSLFKRIKPSNDSTIEIEADITSHFLSPKKVKANLCSFTQKAEVAITTIQTEESVMNKWFLDGRKSFLRGKKRK